ncbi:transposase [Rhizobium laguerreae]|uniref:transposase n=1 Tax=Rhizobium laguerreae TaxID=1076926 RepID=UPI003AB92F7D
MTDLESLEDEEQILCPRCHSQDCVKNGIVRATQRYRCRGCKSNFSMNIDGLIQASLSIFSVTAWATR